MSDNTTLFLIAAALALVGLLTYGEPSLLDAIIARIHP